MADFPAPELGRFAALALFRLFIWDMSAFRFAFPTETSFFWDPLEFNPDRVERPTARWETFDQNLSVSSLDTDSSDTDGAVKNPPTNDSNNFQLKPSINSPNIGQTKTFLRGGSASRSGGRRLDENFRSIGIESGSRDGQQSNRVGVAAATLATRGRDGLSGKLVDANPRGEREAGLRGKHSLSYIRRWRSEGKYRGRTNGTTRPDAQNQSRTAQNTATSEKMKSKERRKSI